VITKRYPVIIEPTSTGYSAYSPDVWGCIAVGDTVEETRQNFQDALLSHFDARREVGSRFLSLVLKLFYVEAAA
jgi:predicted RNase H-like HicB family nuclease